MPPAPAKRPPADNRLLTALTASSRRLLAHAERVEFVHGAVLCKAGTALTHVFFPIDSVISLVAATGAKARLEVGLVGNEGMLGITLMLGIATAPLQWQVVAAGSAWRFEAVRFAGDLANSPELRNELDRYLFVALAQLAQTVVCKRFHLVEARLARWLLMTRDRTHGNTFRATHETLAQLLGVRRAGITRAASSLQKRRLIRYVRGELRILDGRGLEAASCECYAADNDTYLRIMGPAAGAAAGGRTLS